MLLNYHSISTLSTKEIRNFDHGPMREITSDDGEGRIRIDQPTRSPSPHLIEGEAEAKLSPAM